ncbi:hypothetical protein QVD17_11566 [Tagetes erecta]|uniref:Uncharacterized protein n=1 Tax=Tagetes erecta TaxID=13708 RepID=A0AAD8KUQ1_TARER|nr:hypothetical protein QVD17_11566 [Tagetes erecta]
MTRSICICFHSHLQIELSSGSTRKQRGRSRRGKHFAQPFCRSTLHLLRPPAFVIRSTLLEWNQMSPITLLGSIFKTCYLAAPNMGLLLGPWLRNSIMGLRMKPGPDLIHLREVI